VTCRPCYDSDRGLSRQPTNRKKGTCHRQRRPRQILDDAAEARLMAVDMHIHRYDTTNVMCDKQTDEPNSAIDETTRVDKISDSSRSALTVTLNMT